MVTNKTEIGSRIRELRESKGFSQIYLQQKLEVKLKQSNSRKKTISNSTISRIENGTIEKLDVNLLDDIANILGVSLYFIIEKDNSLYISNKEDSILEELIRLLKPEKNSFKECVLKMVKDLKELFDNYK